MEALKQSMNQIATYLTEGEKWHSIVANELRAMPNKRGYARIHDDQATLDGEQLVRLRKLFRDHLKSRPIVDLAYVAKAEQYSIPDFEAFKNHFGVWMSREKVFRETMNKAIDLVRAEDMELYSEFCDMSKCLKIEYMRAEWIWLSLDDCDWGKHHCAVVSKWLHDQAESSPGDWNFNIG